MPNKVTAKLGFAAIEHIAACKVIKGFVSTVPV